MLEDEDTPFPETITTEEAESDLHLRKGGEHDAKAGRSPNMHRFDTAELVGEWSPDYTL
jgi:hypothetical protein